MALWGSIITERKLKIDRKGLYRFHKVKFKHSLSLHTVSKIIVASKIWCDYYYALIAANRIFYSSISSRSKKEVLYDPLLHLYLMEESYFSNKMAMLQYRHPQL